MTLDEFIFTRLLNLVYKLMTVIYDISLPFDGLNQNENITTYTYLLITILCCCVLFVLF